MLRFLKLPDSRKRQNMAETKSSVWNLTEEILRLSQEILINARVLYESGHFLLELAPKAGY